jgi:hypothetical protein
LSRTKRTVLPKLARNSEEKLTLARSTLPIRHLQERFALRLAAALDYLGYPAHRLDRTRTLADALSVDPSVATTLLSGLQLPEYPLLMQICQLTERQPGYFLDEKIQALPEGTTVVKPVGPGEDLVLRLPSDMAGRAETSQGLIYHRAKTRHGYGIEKGDYLIAKAPADHVEAQARSLYLFMEPGGFEVRQCVEVSGSRAIFASSNMPATPFILPASTHATGEDEIVHISQIVARLRGGSELLLHA